MKTDEDYLTGGSGGECASSPVRGTQLPAFPVSTIDGFTQHGMSLRDYFAAKAMGPVHDFRPASFVQWVRWLCGMNYSSPTAKHVDIAREAYKRADAMIAERDLLAARTS